MITAMRKKTKSPWFRAILLIILFFMTIGGSLFVPGLLRRVTQVTEAFIKVNGYSISPAHFLARAQHEHERIEAFRQQFGKQSDMFLHMLGLKDPQKMAYEALIREALLNNVANKIGLPLDETFVVQQLQNSSFVLQELTDIVPIYVLDRSGTINITALRRYLQNIHLSMSEFERLVENALRRLTVIGLMNTMVYVSTDEIRERFVQQYVPKNYKVLPFTFERYVQKSRQLTVSDEKLKVFFKQKNNEKKMYWVPETRTGIVWEFVPESFDISVLAVDIKNYYNKHKHKKYVQSPPQLKLRRILLKVEDETQVDNINKRALQLKKDLDRDPSLFAQYAKQYSQDTKTASQGGLLPWHTKKDLKPIIGTAAFRLSKDGDITDVLRIDEGYEIIQRVERKPKSFKLLDIVKDDIEKILKKQRFSEKFKQVIKQKVSRQAHHKSLKELKEIYNAREIFLKQVELDKSRIRRELFKLKKNSFMYYVDNGKGFVVSLQDIEKSHAPVFDVVKDRVQEDWYYYQSRNMLKEDLQKSHQLAQEKSFDGVAAQFNTPIEHIESLSFEDQKNVEMWSKKGYPVVDFYAMHYVDEIKVFMKDSDGFLVKLVSKGAIDEELFAKKRDEIVRKIYQEMRDRFQRGFVASLRRHATIKTSKEFNNLRSMK